MADVSEFQPVRTAADLATLDEAQILEGYHDGRAGDPEPGNNRSRSYWHGWRNGRCDGHHAEPDAAMFDLIADLRKTPGALIYAIHPWP
jgi:hypothetical protein